MCGTGTPREKLSGARRARDSHFRIAMVAREVPQHGVKPATAAEGSFPSQTQRISHETSRATSWWQVNSTAEGCAARSGNSRCVAPWLEQAVSIGG
jgi:hypothetical protein